MEPNWFFQLLSLKPQSVVTLKTGMYLCAIKRNVLVGALGIIHHVALELRLK